MRTQIKISIPGFQLWRSDNCLSLKWVQWVFECFGSSVNGLTPLIHHCLYHMCNSAPIIFISAMFELLFPENTLENTKDNEVWNLYVPRNI